jgi:hypothetical protein
VGGFFLSSSVNWANGEWRIEKIWERSRLVTYMHSQLPLLPEPKPKRSIGEKIIWTILFSIIGGLAILVVEVLYAKFLF